MTTDDQDFYLTEDASEDHCPLDNRPRANHVVFNWLDILFLAPDVKHIKGRRNVC